MIMREQGLGFNRLIQPGSSRDSMSHKICYVGNMWLFRELAASAGSVPAIPAIPRPASVSGLWKYLCKTLSATLLSP